jgi:hypothetical protein
MLLALRLGFCLCVIVSTAISSLLLQGGPGLTVRALAAGEPIQVELYGSDGLGLIRFDDLCATSMAPGDVCTDVLLVRHAGGDSGGPFAYVISAWADLNNLDAGLLGPSNDELEACFNVGLTPGGDGANAGSNPAVGPLSGSPLDPFETEAWRIAVTIDDNDACQERGAYILVLVQATGDDLSSGTGEPQQDGSIPTIDPLPPAAPLDDGGEGESPTALPNTGLGPGAGSRTWLWSLVVISIGIGAALLGASVALERKQR